MANLNTLKTSFTAEYIGDGGKSGGTYTCSSVKNDASDAGIELAARAVTDLQSKMVKKIFKVVGAELTR